METPLVAPTPPAETARIFELRPMSIGDLLDRVVFFYRRHFGALVLYSAALYVPLTLFLFLTTIANFIPFFAPDTFADNPALALSAGFLSIAGSFGVIVVSYLTTALQFSGIAVAAEGFVLEGRRSSARDIWAAVRARLGSIVALIFVIIVFGIVASVAALIAALTVIGIPFALAALTIFTIASALAYPVLMYERRDAVESLRRAWLLVCSDIRRVVAFFILYYLFSFIISGLFLALFGVAIGLGAAVTEDAIFLLVLQPLAQLFIGVLVSPLYSAVVSMLYFDLRIRSEGLDVALMADAAAGEPLALASAPVTQETVLGEMPRRAVLTLGGIYTLVIVLSCALLGGIIFLAGNLG